MQQSHYEDEYILLTKFLSTLGEMTEANNGLKCKLRAPIPTNVGEITTLRVRRPDPYRMQVGCGDLIVFDYKKFKEGYLPAAGLKIIERPEYEMVEFFDPDFDVLAYVVGKG